MTARPPPPWDAIRRAAALFHVELKVEIGRHFSDVRLRSVLGAHAGHELAGLMVVDLAAEDADRVLRALAATALLQLGPGADVAAEVLDQVAALLEVAGG